jgi:hypothetical protein
VMAAIPPWPERSDSQLSGALLPTGDTAPIPVTTTRRGASAMVEPAHGR